MHALLLISDKPDKIRSLVTAQKVCGTSRSIRNMNRNKLQFPQQRISRSMENLETILVNISMCQESKKGTLSTTGSSTENKLTKVKYLQRDRVIFPILQQQLPTFSSKWLMKTGKCTRSLPIYVCTTNKL